MRSDTKRKVRFAKFSRPPIDIAKHKIKARILSQTALEEWLKVEIPRILKENSRSRAILKLRRNPENAHTLFIPPFDKTRHCIYNGDVWSLRALLYNNLRKKAAELGFQKTIMMRR